MESPLVEFKCNYCGGRLVTDEIKRVFVCSSCRTQYYWNETEDSNSELVEVLQRKEVQCGQFTKKASSTGLTTITPKTIVINDTASVEVTNDISEVSISESLKNIETYLKTKDWDEARMRLEGILADANNHNPKAYWYRILCDKRISNPSEYKTKFVNFNKSNAIDLDNVFAFASPEYGRSIFDIMVANAYGADDSCLMILSTIIPYSYNQSLFSPSKQQNYVDRIVQTLIENSYVKSFDYMLRALDSSRVDAYIEYLKKFAEKPACPRDYAIECYKRILDVDEGNNEVRRELIKKQFQHNDACIKDISSEFERLVNYSQNVDNEVLFLTKLLNSEKTTTEAKSELLWTILGYYSSLDKLVELEDELLKYTTVLLNSKMWNKAYDYCVLILHNNNKCAYAFLYICLSKLKVKTENDVYRANGYLSSCPEYEKFTALLDENKRRYYQQLSKKQKKAKNAQFHFRKTGKILVVCAIVAVILILVVIKIIKVMSYSEKNVVLEVTGKDTSAVYFSVNNVGSNDIDEITGIIRAYDGGTDIVWENDLVLNGPFVADCDDAYIYEISEATVGFDFVAYNYDELAFSFQLESIVYCDGVNKTYSTDEIIIKSFDGSELERCLDEAETAINTMISNMEIMHEQSTTIDNQITNAFLLIEDYYGLISRNQRLSNIMEAAADTFVKDGEYYKAFYIYSFLAYVHVDEEANEVLANQYYDWFTHGAPINSVSFPLSGNSTGVTPVVPETTYEYVTNESNTNETEASTTASTEYTNETTEVTETTSVPTAAETTETTAGSSSGVNPYTDPIMSVDVNSRYNDVVSAIQNFDPNSSDFSVSYSIQQILDYNLNGLSWSSFESHGYAQALYDVANNYYNQGNTSYALGIFNFLAEHGFSDSSSRAAECQ